jgi:hypothetical protein
MIGQMRVLLRVKDLKLDQALRVMQAKRAERELARQERVAAENAVAESEATYAAREDAIYADIIGEIIGQDGIDTTHGRVVQLQKAHAALKDELERALHVEARLEQELQAATAAYFAAQRMRDKFSMITDNLQTEIDTAAENREEIEVEDLFARPRQKVA